MTVSEEDKIRARISEIKRKIADLENTVKIQNGTMKSAYSEPFKIEGVEGSFVKKDGKLYNITIR